MAIQPASSPHRRLRSSPPARTESRVLNASGVRELYLTITPVEHGSLEDRARALYTELRGELVQSGAAILSERLFASSDAISTVEAVRNELLGDFDAGVAPTRIVVSPSPVSGTFPGAQIHAVRGPAPPTAMRCWDRPDSFAGRLFEVNGHRWLFVNGLCGTNDAGEAQQAARMFACAGCFLEQAGGSMKSVPRTWLWLKDVCEWYGDLNRARTTFFRRAGLIDDETRTTRLPASTGIGLHAPGGSACTLDFIALPGREDEIRLVEAGGDQKSAFEYGSAFSRAAVAPMPGGRTVFISGTAAIDVTGSTEHSGRVEAQVDATIAHVRSLLKDLDCTDAHVLTALVYAKNAEVERVFRERWGDLCWPRLTMIGDVCRPELAFEVEVTASPELDVSRGP